MRDLPPTSGTGRARAAKAPKAIRVLLSGQLALVRAGVHALLEQMDEVEGVVEAAGDLQALELLTEFNPDVVLLDISSPGLSGLGILKEIVGRFPGVRVIVLAAPENPEYVVHALRSGAAGFIPKSAGRTELERAIKAVARGETYLTPEISRQAILEYVKDPRAIPTELTARQSEVLQLIADGHTTKEIAQGLDISVKTVESHRASLMERLDIHDVAGLVRYAIRIGLVEL